MNPNIGPKNHPNVGTYTIHGAYGYEKWWLSSSRRGWLTRTNRWSWETQSVARWLSISYEVSREYGYPKRSLAPSFTTGKYRLVILHPRPKHPLPRVATSTSCNSFFHRIIFTWPPMWNQKGHQQQVCRLNHNESRWDNLLWLQDVFILWIIILSISDILVFTVYLHVWLHNLIETSKHPSVGWELNVTLWHKWRGHQRSTSELGIPLFSMVTPVERRGD